MPRRTHEPKRNHRKRILLRKQPKRLQYLTSLLTSEDQVVMESTANLWLNLYEFLGPFAVLGGYSLQILL